MRTLSLYIATSVDGYIAGPNEDISFLRMVDKEGEDYGYVAFTATVDTIILGRKTYDWVQREVGTSHYDNGDRDLYVITRTARPDAGRTKFYTGDWGELVLQFKNVSGKDTYCDGGAELVNELLKHDLIDEFILSVVSVLVGSGTKHFNDGRPEQALELIDSKAFDMGLVQLKYRRNSFQKTTRSKTKSYI